jgi:hypothetical protein
LALLQRLLNAFASRQAGRFAGLGQADRGAGAEEGVGDARTHAAAAEDADVGRHAR